MSSKSLRAYPTIGVLTGLVLLLIVFGIPPASGADAGSDHDIELAAVESVEDVAVSSIPCDGRETTVLVQDNVPWSAAGNQDPLGANVTELLAAGAPFCILTSGELLGADLSRVRAIILASAQVQSYYDNLFPLPEGDIVPLLKSFVWGGGVVVANLTDDASGPGNGGDWNGRTFIAGLTQVGGNADDNSIVAASHPIVTGNTACPSRNCRRIADREQYRDLDGWNWSSHSHFGTLPAGTSVIFADDDGDPVMVEYTYGKGLVIANLMTVEYRYTGGFGGLPQNLKLLANLFAYQAALISG